MHHISFGNVLKEARLAKGMDIASVSRQLRIRQDIIVAIENNDFSRMPPRGYTRNMITAYARLVGLNPTDVSRLYLDQEYAHQINRAHSSMNSNLNVKRSSVSGSSDRDNLSRTTKSTTQFDRIGGATQGRKASSYSSSQETDVDTLEGSTNSLGRRLYTSQPRCGYTRDAGQRTSGQPQVLHTARRSAVDGTSYGNMVAQPTNYNRTQRDPRLKFVIAGIIAIVVIVFAVLFITSHSSQQSTNIPVTGAESKATTETTSETKKKTTEKAPTEFTLKYELAEDATTYIEVYVDGSCKEAGTVTGKAEETYKSSDTMKFICTDPSGVTLTVDGEVIELTPSSAGVCTVEYNFADILNAWYDEHPDVKKPSSTSDDTNDSSTTADEGSNTDSSSTSSSTSSRSSSSTASSSSTSSNSSSASD